MIVHHTGRCFRDGVGREIIRLRTFGIALDVAVNDIGI